MSRFQTRVITEVGSYFYTPQREHRPEGGRMSLHVEGSSFNLDVRATNFVTLSINGTSVASLWRTISNITSPGIYNFPEAAYAAYLLQVNSLVSSNTLTAAFGGLICPGTASGQVLLSPPRYILL